MHEKWSTSIVKELMEVAGGDPWRKWKAEAVLAGVPVLPGEEAEDLAVKRPVPKTALPSLKAFRASAPQPTQGDSPPAKSGESKPNASIPPMSAPIETVPVSS